MFFLKHLRIRLRHHAPLSCDFIVYLLGTKDIFLYNLHNKCNCKIKKKTLIYYSYAIYGPYSNFINCPNDVLYSYFSPQSKL